MATNRKLRSALLAKLGVSPQRLSQKVASLKKQHGPMETEDGTYVLAHLEGLDLSKYLSRDTVDRIRGMIPGKGSAPASQKQEKGKPQARVRKPVRIGAQVDSSDPLLPESVVAAAGRMAEVYARLYVLENSIRNVILRVLHAEHGKDWWTKCAPAPVQADVTRRKGAEAKTPWHGKRGAHDIHYSDFGDLRKTIEKNWDSFAELFPNRPWITQRLSELEPPRNVVAHCNPLSESDRNRIDLYYDDWMKLLKAKRAGIPER